MRLKRCKHCGRDFETAKQGAYLCPECALAARRASVYRERVCAVCGRTFRGYPKTKRCPECAALAAKDAAARYRQHGPARPIGSTDTCAACGREYVVNSSRQMYCPDCAKSVVPENIRAAKRAYNAVYAPEHAEEKEANRTGNKVCPICGAIVDTGRADVYCSPECRRAARRQWDKAAPSHQPEARRAAREAKRAEKE